MKSKEMKTVHTPSDDTGPLRIDRSDREACTAFAGHDRLLSGRLPDAALAIKRAAAEGSTGPFLIFDDANGRVMDVDLRGSDAEVNARLTSDTDEAPAVTRKRGRPALGVIGREVTLLPRHWDWLSARPGGASVALRKLVDAARRTNADDDRRRESQERAYRFMAAVAGDLPGYEEALRALFADDRPRFDNFVASWPEDVAAYSIYLAFTD